MVSALEVLTVAGVFGITLLQLENLASKCKRTAGHKNLKVLIVKNVPLLLRFDISPALMARIDYLTVKHGWTLRRNCDSGKLIEFTNCK